MIFGPNIKKVGSTEYDVIWSEQNVNTDKHKDKTIGQNVIMWIQLRAFPGKNTR
jgi:hypothetical protein